MTQGRITRRGLRALALVTLALALAGSLAERPVGATLAPVSARAAECNGDECQGPPPAPEEVTPGTAVVEGPENPPVHFPKPHHPKQPHRKPEPPKHRNPPSHQRAHR
jgi:outer membrane biosynthesis protein TonB